VQDVTHWVISLGHDSVWWRRSGVGVTDWAWPWTREQQAVSLIRTFDDRRSCGRFPQYKWGATWKKTCRGSGLEILEYGRREPSHWPRGIFYPQKLTLTYPAWGSRSVGIVRSQTQATEFFYVWSPLWAYMWLWLDAFLLQVTHVAVREGAMRVWSVLSPQREADRLWLPRRDLVVSTRHTRPASIRPFLPVSTDARETTGYEEHSDWPQTHPSPLHCHTQGYF
jgi:hypothetical protein